MKVYIGVFLLIVSANVFYAQDRVNITDYGVYLVKNGVIEKIPAQYEIGISCFVENYIILEGYQTLGCCIYNMDTKTISEWIWGFVIQVEKGEEPIFYFSISWPYGPDEGYWKYTYTSDMLVLKSKVKLPENPFLPELQKIKKSSFLYYGNDFLQRTTEEILDVRLFRYKGENFYLDVDYGPKIDLTGKYFYIINGGVKNTFILQIQEVDTYR